MILSEIKFILQISSKSSECNKELCSDLQVNEYKTKSVLSSQIKLKNTICTPESLAIVILNCVKPKFFLPSACRYQYWVL